MLLEWISIVFTYLNFNTNIAFYYVPWFVALVAFSRYLPRVRSDLLASGIHGGSDHVALVTGRAYRVLGDDADFFHRFVATESMTQSSDWSESIQRISQPRPLCCSFVVSLSTFAA